MSKLFMVVIRKGVKKRRYHFDNWEDAYRFKKLYSKTSIKKSAEIHKAELSDFKFNRNIIRYNRVM